MLIDVQKAVVQRWNEAGLRTSITSLYPGGDSDRSNREEEGSPTFAYAFPRADFFVKERTSAISVGSYSKVVQVRFRIWHNNEQTLGGWMKDINDAYINMTETGITLDSGLLSGFRYEGGTLVKEDDNVFLGIAQFEADYSDNTALKPTV
jgi:hypothetical protein